MEIEEEIPLWRQSWQTPFVVLKNCYNVVHVRFGSWLKVSECESGLHSACHSKANKQFSDAFDFPISDFLKWEYTRRIVSFGCKVVNLQTFLISTQGNEANYLKDARRFQT